MRTINDAELAARLRLSVTRLARRLRQKSDVEATASQISALATIERLGPLTIGELSAAERVQPPSMTRIVAGLEELDLIQRETDERDRRVARVRVTSLGQRLLERSRSKKNAYLAARLGSLSDEERVALAHAADILERLLESDE
jgi:DNA-binding MarR family transcriptional regulator